jgi:hypothetical protein
MTIDEPSGPALALHDGVPVIIDEGVVRKTTAPALFETGGGLYIAYADGWQQTLNGLFPDGYEEAAEAAAARFAIDVSEPPTIWLLVAMTLED